MLLITFRKVCNLSSMSSKFERLYPGEYYHIFNRTNNNELLFLDDGNRRFFLKKYRYFLYPFIKTFAYCLIDNHFHFLIQIREGDEIINQLEQKPNHIKTKIEHQFLKELNNIKNDNSIGFDMILSSQFQRFFSSYTKSFNKLNRRNGNLFNQKFKRKLINDESYLTKLIYYIHANPMKHKLVLDFRDFKWSSYQSIVSIRPTLLERPSVLNWFGGISGFKSDHADWFGLELEHTLEIQ